MKQLKSMGLYLVMVICLVAAANLVESGFWQNLSALILDMFAATIFFTHFELKNG